MVATEGDVNGEEDLERIAVGAVKELNNLLKQPFDEVELKNCGVDKIAEMMAALRRQVGGVIKLNEKREGVMNKQILKIMEKVKQEIPGAGRKLDDKDFKRVIIKTLQLVNKEIVESEDGKVNIPGLGRFVKREIDKNGEKLSRITFIPAD